MQSNLTIKIIEAVRRVSKFLIRDFYEIDKLKSSGNSVGFVDTAAFRTDKLLKKEFASPVFDTLLPEGCSWLIIPIEGRINFLYGIPYFCVLVTLFVKGIAMISVVDCPIVKETYFAERGYGLNLQDLSSIFRLRAARKSSIKSALICSNSFNLGVGHGRNFGSGILHLLFMASGRCDACVYKLPEQDREQIVSTFNLITNESNAKASVINDFFVASNLELHSELCNNLSKLIK